MKVVCGFLLASYSFDELVKVQQLKTSDKEYQNEPKPKKAEADYRQANVNHCLATMTVEQIKNRFLNPDISGELAQVLSDLINTHQFPPE